MKKILFCSLFIFLVLAGSFAMSIKKNSESPFMSSSEMLKWFYIENSMDEATAEVYDGIKVSLLTMTKEDPIYSWFGHTAILVEIPDDSDLMFDYGRFSFGDDFVFKFAIGQLWYKCCVSYADYELAVADSNTRSVSAVELNLNSIQKKALLEFLLTNVSEHYNTYLYHNYRDNCATRIRDIINIITDGDFENWAKAQPGLSFREQISGILGNNIPCLWLLDFLQSGYVDTACTRWDEMFLPDNLEKAVTDYAKLGSEVRWIVDNRAEDTRPVNKESPFDYRWISLAAGLVLGILAIVLILWNRTAYGIFTCVFNAVLGLLGLLLLFLMTCTSHDFTWFNGNILFVNPALLIAAVFSIRNLKHRKFLICMYSVLLSAIAVMAIGKVILPSVFIQENIPQMVTLIPYYLCNIIALKVKKTGDDNV